MAARKDASRRKFLELAGVGTLGLALAPVLVARTPRRSVRVVSSKAAPAADPAQAKVATEPAVVDDARAYLGDLIGKRLGKYRVESIGALERGGIPVEMKTSSGVRFRVDVLRFDPREGNRGIGELSSVTVCLRNGGKGRKTTDEALGLGAMTLARELARRDRAGAVPPSGLLTMGERAAFDASVT